MRVPDPSSHALLISKAAEAGDRGNVQSRRRYDIKRHPALPDSNDSAPLLSRRNVSKRDILET
jgi:hypothetical protein